MTPPRRGLSPEQVSSITRTAEERAEALAALRQYGELMATLAERLQEAVDALATAASRIKSLTR